MGNEVDDEMIVMAETGNQRRFRLRKKRASQKNAEFFTVKETKLSRKEQREQGIKPEDKPTPHECHADTRCNRDKCDSKLIRKGFFLDLIDSDDHDDPLITDYELEAIIWAAANLPQLAPHNNPVRELVTNTQVIDLTKETTGHLPEYSDSELEELSEYLGTGFVTVKAPA